METVVLNINSKFEKHSFNNDDSKPKLRVGRAFSNDVIITDPYVGANQLTLEQLDQKEEAWLVTNTDGANPVLLNRKTVNDPEFVIQSGDKVTIGRTHITVYSENHTVPETREFSFINWLNSHRLKPILTIGMLLLLAAVMIGKTYFSTYTELEWGKLSIRALIPLLIAIIWASTWALAGRFLKTQHYFASHLFFSALIIGLMVLTHNTYSYIDYFTSNTYIAEGFDWALSVLLLGLLIGISLTLVTHSRGALWKGFVASLCIFSLLLSFTYLSSEEYDNLPEHTSSVKPGFFPSPDTISVDKHIDEYDVLFRSLANKNENQ